MMETEKVVITCPKCGTKIRFPILEKRIKFKCTNCNEAYYAENGTIISPDQNRSSAAKQPKKNRNRELWLLSLKSFFTKLVAFSSKILQRKIFWQMSTIITMAASIYLINLLNLERQDRIKDRQIKDQLTTDLLSKLQNGKLDNFSKSKKLLTGDTKFLVETFIESQYLYNDSVSVDMIDKFLSTLSPLEYREQRKIRYLTVGGDTMYFYIDYVKYNDAYLINADIRDFIE